MNSAKNLPVLGAYPERSEGIDSAKGDSLEMDFPHLTRERYLP